MKSLGPLAKGALFVALAGSCGGDAVVRVPPSSPALVAPPRAREVTAKELAAEVPALYVVLDAPRFAASEDECALRWPLRSPGLPLEVRHFALAAAETVLRVGDPFAEPPS